MLNLTQEDMDNELEVTTAAYLGTPLGKAYMKAVVIALHMGIGLEYAWRKYVKPKFDAEMAREVTK